MTSSKVSSIILSKRIQYNCDEKMYIDLHLRNLNNSAYLQAVAQSVAREARDFESANQGELGKYIRCFRCLIDALNMYLNC